MIMGGREKTSSTENNHQEMRDSNEKCSLVDLYCSHIANKIKMT